MSYYVYAYLREDRFSPYYVGKGQDKSYRHLSPNHNVTVPANRERVVIIKDNLTNEESQALERALIRFWGRQDNGTGVLRNRTDGGEGTDGYKHREDTKRVLSEQKKGKQLWGGSRLITWGDKISEAKKGQPSPNKGKPMSQEAKDKLSRAMTGRKLSEEHKEKLRGKNLGHTHNNKSCVVRGRHFSSHKEAIQYYGVSQFRTLVKRGWVDS